MAIELITGMSGTPHISSDDVRAFNRSMFGAGSYVLSGCEAQITSPNNVHINPGELMIGGGHSRITGTGENATIQNGAAGKVRTDAICVHYTRNAGGIESVAIQVVKGADVATGNVPVAPSGSGSMANNDSDVVTVLYLVDVTVSGVENLRKHESIENNPVATLNSEPLPVKNGGTGADNPEEARANLGLDDTGWVNLASGTDWFIEHRRVGNLVEIRGKSTGGKPLAKGYQDVASLPSDLIPNIRLGETEVIVGSVGVMGAQTSFASEVIVKQDGKLNLYVSNALSYWHFNVMYFVG